MKHIFIVNPYAGRLNFANNLRDQLEQIEGLEYYLFNSRYSGNETELAEKMTNFFPDEKIRIYACGGSGTFRNVLQGVGENPNVELAFYPCGQTNDFLKVFKEEDQMRFFDIEELIDGEPREMAMFRLEAYILFCILSGLFDWDAVMGRRWFWASDTDRDLVILGRWIRGAA